MVVRGIQVAWNSAEISAEKVVPRHFYTKTLKGQKMKVYSTPSEITAGEADHNSKALECKVKSRVIITETVKSS